MVGVETNRLWSEQHSVQNLDAFSCSRGSDSLQVCDVFHTQNKAIKKNKSREKKTSKSKKMYKVLIQVRRLQGGVRPSRSRV